MFIVVVHSQNIDHKYCGSLPSNEENRAHKLSLSHFLFVLIYFLALFSRTKSLLVSVLVLQIPSSGMLVVNCCFMLSNAFGNWLKNECVCVCKIITREEPHRFRSFFKFLCVCQNLRYKFLGR